MADNLPRLARQNGYIITWLLPPHGPLTWKCRLRLWADPRQYRDFPAVPPHKRITAERAAIAWLKDLAGEVDKAKSV